MSTINSVGTGLVGASGTGAFAGTNSPTFVTPALGTPSALVLTNATGLPVAGGGTGLASTTANQLLYSSATSTIAGLATANNGLLVTSAAGVPSIGNAIGANITVNGVQVGKGASNVATNTVFGVAAGNSFTASSNNNACFGYISGTAITDGVGNTCTGSVSGGHLTTGSFNVYVGRSAGESNGSTNVNTTTATYSTCIGYSAGTGSADSIGILSLGANASADKATGSTSGTDGPGVAIGSVAQPVGFRGDGSIYPGNLWRVKVNGTKYMIPLAADGSTSLPVANGGTGATTSTGSGSVVLATSPTMVTPVLGSASATSLSFSSTSGIIGTTTNNNAAAGSVGEYIESVITSGSAVSLTTSTQTNITSIILTAGDWDVWGSWVMTWAAGTTSVNRQGGISTVSATLPNGVYITKNNNPTTAGTGDEGYPVPSQRISLSGTTTVYLVAFSVFAVSTMSAYGFVAARRVR